MTQSIPTYFQNAEAPIIRYKYNKATRNTIFNFNKIVSDLDIHALEFAKIQNIFINPPDI